MDLERKDIEENNLQEKEESLTNAFNDNDLGEEKEDREKPSNEEGNEPLETVVDEAVNDRGEVLKTNKKSRKKVLVFSITGVIAAIFLGVFLIGNHMLNRINYEDESDVYRVPTDLTVNAESVKKVENGGEEEFIDDRKKSLYNILLIGEERDKTETRGRSDTNIILSINKKQKTIKLISFLRDSYVEIPGYLGNRINTAYAKGGGPLLCDTIQENFGIHVDGYIRVEFKDFEKIIDELGGVEITLTEEEAEYLNTTNYISKRKYRNVVKGKQKLNGCQALGYCRIRKLPTIDGIHNDWGRTARQRKVLMQIYEEYKAKNVVELITLMNDVLPIATTNMKKSDLIYLLRLVMSLNINEVETLAIPVANGYQNLDIPDRDLYDMLGLDFDINNKEIKDFMNEKGEYAKSEEKEEGEDPSPSETPMASPTKPPKASASPGIG